MDKDGYDSRRIRFFWYFTKIILWWNVVKPGTVDIFELNGLWCYQEESYEGARAQQGSSSACTDCVSNYHASDYTSIKHQVDINGTENVKAKLTFEKEDKSQEVMIKVYHTDTFNTSKFMEKLFNKHKKLRFSAAGASHQNGAGSRARYQ